MPTRLAFALLFALLLAGCGAAPAAPLAPSAPSAPIASRTPAVLPSRTPVRAQTAPTRPEGLAVTAAVDRNSTLRSALLGRWQDQAGAGRAITFFANGGYLEELGSGQIRSGLYTISGSGSETTISFVDEQGTTISGQLLFEGDQLCLPPQRCFLRSTSAPLAQPSPSSAVIAAVPVATVPASAPLVVATITPAAPFTRRTISTEDGFVAVRSQPNTSGDLLAQLTPGTIVTCTRLVSGQRLLHNGQTTDQWAECPSVGGYIFWLLLE